MSYSLNSLGGTIGVIKGDTRSLVSGSYEVPSVLIGFKGLGLGFRFKVLEF